MPAGIENGGEDQADPALPVTVAMVHGGGEVWLVAVKAHADFLGSLAADPGNGGLTELEFAGRRVPLPVGVSRALAQGEQHLLTVEQ
ncbi:hypothetical protein L3i22_038910 [Actinoplanes sp. L3-i22]|nr:hypothetical protein L3i22_038910 [Actinoplanes sp. L3-i22]